MKSLRVAFAGTPDVAVPALEALADSNHDLVAVLTKPDAPVGRGRKLQSSAVAEAAHEHNVPVHMPERLNGFAETLQKWEVDVVAVVAYGLLVPQDLLSIPAFGWINAHFSRLPRWRGAAPAQHAIAHGDASTAVTTFRINSGLDTGPILLESSDVPIGEREDSGHLLQRLAPVGAELLVATVDALAAGEVDPREQPVEGATSAPRLTTSDARIDWTRPAIDVDRWIRACTPAPGPWTTFEEQRMRIGVPTEFSGESIGSPGTVRLVDKLVRVATGEGSVELDQVQPAGRKWMAADAWIRGLRTGELHVD